MIINYFISIKVKSIPYILILVIRLFRNIYLKSQQ